MPNILPRPPSTELQNPGCYLRETRDCSHRLTKEHFISKDVLEVLGDMVAVDGAAWMTPGEQREIGIGSLSAHVLCDRHNSALSPLDQTAGIFFARLLKIHADMKRQSLSRKGTVWLTNGEALERWMLKAAVGYFFSKHAGSQDGAVLADDHAIDLHLVQRALFAGDWQPGCGLYTQGLGATFNTAGAVSIAALMSASEKRVVGARLIIGGLFFELVFDSRDAKGDWYAGHVYRPAELIFRNRQRSHRIWLSWPMSGVGQSLTLSYLGSKVRRKARSQG